MSELERERRRPKLNVSEQEVREAIAALLERKDSAPTHEKIRGELIARGYRRDRPLSRAQVSKIISQLKDKGYLREEKRMELVEEEAVA